PPKRPQPTPPNPSLLPPLKVPRRERRARRTEVREAEECATAEAAMSGRRRGDREAITGAPRAAVHAATAPLVRGDRREETRTRRGRNRSNGSMRSKRLS